MRAVQFPEFGSPEVLHLVEVPEPHATPGTVRIAVDACGLNPADWGLCAGLFGGQLPQGIGLEVSGTVDELGDGVSGVAVGDVVFAPVTPGSATLGAADFAVVSQWKQVPDGLDLPHAAALPMAFETAYRGLDELGVQRDDLVLVHGSGGVVGGAAVRLALLRGARVIGTAGAARAEDLRRLGAQITSYGDGMVERVTELAGDHVDRALDVSPGGSLPDLIELAGDPSRVLTLTDFDNADAYGVRASGRDDLVLRYDVLDEVARLAAGGSFTVPIAQSFPLERFPDAARLSESGHSGGKLMLTVSS